MSAFSDIINSDVPVLIDFSAEWCGPCKTMAPIIKEVKNLVGNRAKVLKIDVDKNPALAQKLQIQGVPTLVIYKNGAQLWRTSGVVPAHQLSEILLRHI